MRVKNSTRYRTDDLRRLFLAGLKAEGVDPRRYVIESVPARTRRVNGQGSYYGEWVKLMIPALAEIERTADTRTMSLERELAKVFIHEVGHNQGLHHKDMMSWQSIKVPWAEGLQLREKQLKAEAPRDVQAERAAHAQAKLAEHERKLKREQALTRKWRRKVRYYSKALAARKAALPRPKVET